MPWRTPFKDERCLPSGVRGPVDFFALARLAARRASEMGRLGFPSVAAPVVSATFAPMSRVSAMICSAVFSLFELCEPSALLF